MTTNKTIQYYIDSIGMVPTMSDYNEQTKCFSNGYRASVLDTGDGKYSCAYCDYNGYFNWYYPGTSTVGIDDGAHIFNTEEEVCAFIKAVSELPAMA
jgi:uncharacterized protein with LGFP repeats